jgi:hypothetical protein
MKTNFILLTLVTIFFLNGCSKIDTRPVAMQRMDSDMREKVKYVKYVGDTVVNRYDYTELRGISLTEDFTESHYGGDITFQTGDFLNLYVEDYTEDKYYCGLYYKTMTSSQPNNTICFTENDNRINEFYIMVGRNYKYGPYTLSTDLPYTRDAVIDTRKSFRKIELIYDGMHKDMMLFTYREFIDDTRRPSFYSKVRFRKHRGTTTFTYKSAKIKVYRANNKKIEYVILSPLRFSY